MSNNPFLTPQITASSLLTPNKPPTAATIQPPPVHPSLARSPTQPLASSASLSPSSTGSRTYSPPSGAPPQSGSGAGYVPPSLFSSASGSGSREPLTLSTGDGTLGSGKGKGRLSGDNGDKLPSANPFRTPQITGNSLVERQSTLSSLASPTTSQHGPPPVHPSLARAASSSLSPTSTGSRGVYHPPPGPPPGTNASAENTSAAPVTCLSPAEGARGFQTEITSPAADLRSVSPQSTGSESLAAGMGSLTLSPARPSPSPQPSPSRSYAPPPGPPPLSRPNTSPTPSPSAPPPNTPPRTEPVVSAPDPAPAESVPSGPEEPPPPYTPTPDQWQGEETVQYGPRRPWTAAPAPFRELPAEAVLGGGPSTSPSPNPSGRPVPGRGPPPRHPSTRVSSISSSGPGSTLRPEPNPNQRRPVSDSFRPPPGPPPPNAGSNSNAGRERREEVPNDGKPTRTPVAGHPFMHQGMVLVYPARYACSKCLNTGYKYDDVTHPCRKCWDRYGRSYEGSPLAYADWSPAARLSGTANNFQRPLPPDIRIPQARPPAREYPSQQNNFHASNSAGYPYAPSPPSAVVSRPPPGALVVQPGDPRIGGQLCPRCQGPGVVPGGFLWLEDEICQTCGGSGRVFW